MAPSNVKVLDVSDVSLICKYCGYKQEDSDVIRVTMQRFPDEDVHDLHYMCGACDSQLPF